MHIAQPKTMMFIFGFCLGIYTWCMLDKYIENDYEKNCKTAYGLVTYRSFNDISAGFISDGIKEANRGNWANAALFLKRADEVNGEINYEETVIGGVPYAKK